MTRLLSRLAWRGYSCEGKVKDFQETQTKTKE
jgi:hypothetical protein